MKSPACRPIVLVAVACEAGLGLLSIVAGWLSDQDLLEKVRFSALDLAWGIATAVPMLVVFGLVLSSKWRRFEEIRAVLEEFLRPLLAGCSFGELAILSLAAGLG